MITKVKKPLMSKRAAIAAARGGKKSAAKSKPASKKAKKGNVSPKPKSAALDIPGPEEQQLRQQAAELDKQMAEVMADAAKGLNNTAERLSVAKEIAFKVSRDKLWKKMETPWKSFQEWVSFHSKDVQLSTRTLKGAVSFGRALPQLSGEQRKKIGTRKGKKLVKAVKVLAKKQGKKVPDVQLPPEVIKTAEQGTEADLEKVLIDADLAEPKTAIHPEPAADTLLHRETVEQPFRRGGFQSSGSVEGATGEAVQFNSTVQGALDVATELYQAAELGAGNNFNALEFVCRFFLKAQYVGPDERFQDTTNQAAFDELFVASGKQKNGSSRKKK